MVCNALLDIFAEPLAYAPLLRVDVATEEALLLVFIALLALDCIELDNPLSNPPNAISPTRS